MTSVFISYSSRDYFFVELLASKLAAQGFTTWRDSDTIRAGDDWRQSIEEGIAGSDVVLIALSSNSADSPYVTFEWAYALGVGKPVFTLRLGECKMHPRLEPIHYFDFSYPKSLPWDELLKRLSDTEYPDTVTTVSGSTRKTSSGDAKAIREILAYLDKHGFTMASFERLHERVLKAMPVKAMHALVDRNSTTFRHVKLRDAKPGLAKVVP
jgi:hypothetical protein